jgi:predicted ATPase
MSWSINFIGSPENVSKALELNSANLTGQSKSEYDAALPHLKALVEQNVNNNYPITVRIDANGHGDTTGNNSVNVNIGYGAQLA